MIPQDFVRKWSGATGNERKLYQQHFLDLCELVGHPKPADDDPTGAWFTFEAGVTKAGGGQGFADVWKKGFFAWEYKGHHADLTKAYQQLLQYKDSLFNPPLLVVSDIHRILIHTNFTNTPKRIVELGLDDLLTPTGLAHLRAVFFAPESFRADKTTEQVTREAAEQFSRLAALLHLQGHAPERVAHFLIRLLFCLFAEDISLLPDRLFTRLVDRGRLHPDAFNHQLAALFTAMAQGGFFGEHEIRHFNGGLFDSGDAVDLNHEALGILHGVTALDWSAIEPSIIGTLFERSLDPSKRAMLGAHYTSRDDILLIVEPVLMAPLRREWDAAHAKLQAEVAKREAAIAEWQERKDRSQTAISSQIQGINTSSRTAIAQAVRPVLERVRAMRVLDPACGSGNFLYLSLRQLMDLEKEIITAATAAGQPPSFPQVSPAQLFGIEINEYAHELAQATVWIGWIQWLHENGFGAPSEPILKPMDNIRQMDAILTYDADGKPVESEWPATDVIVGNPPFLGGKLLRTELTDAYVDTLFQLYDGKVERQADLVCYWFERARVLIEQDRVQRAGLLATNSIRGGANRTVLERIKQTGDIFMAWSDRPWILDGAAVRVSMVGFDDGSETARYLDGQTVLTVHADLSASIDLTHAAQLSENAGLAFMGDTKVGPFDIDSQTAARLLGATGNPNGRPNGDVIVPWVNGMDITRRPRGMYIIDFGVGTSEFDSAQYEAPFEYARKHVKPFRAKAKSGDATGIPWWLHQRPRPEMRDAIRRLSRYIITPRVAKHRLFAWLPVMVLPDSATIAIARDDDYFFGVLHSRFHELWSLRMGTWLGVGNDPRYTPTTTFGTFPFPWPPGKEPADDPRVQVIAAAARELNEQRERWLNPPGAAEAELKKRTLTNLYNDRPMWLQLAHARLDAAVAAAYGWPAELADDEILARLLALNLERAGKRD